MSHVAGLVLTYVVVVEKPFTNTSAAAEKLIALAKEKGKVLTVFQSGLSLIVVKHKGPRR